MANIQLSAEGKQYAQDFLDSISSLDRARKIAACKAEYGKQFDLMSNFSDNGKFREASGIAERLRFIEVATESLGGKITSNAIR